jgi:hypothetical protein
MPETSIADALKVVVPESFWLGNGDMIVIKGGVLSGNLVMVAAWATRPRELKIRMEAVILIRIEEYFFILLMLLN